MKLAKDLEPGDRVRMEDGKIREVENTARGIATFVKAADGTRTPGVMIMWKDREFSTVPRDFECTLEGEDA